MIYFQAEKKVHAKLKNLLMNLNIVATKENKHKPIINHGGVLENEVKEDGHIEQRYWIQL